MSATNRARDHKRALKRAHERDHVRTRMTAILSDHPPHRSTAKRIKTEWNEFNAELRKLQKRREGT